MSIVVLIISLFLAVCDWIAIAQHWKRLEYFTKPAALIIPLIWLIVIGGDQKPMLWFLLGLFFSILGDVLLMLPDEKFVLGLGSFLLTHVFYLIGFNNPPIKLNVPVFILAIVLLLINVESYPRIARGCDSCGQGKVKGSILMYAGVISLMLLAAISTLVQPEWRLIAAILVSTGGLFFFISDFILAWNRFVESLPYAKVMIMFAYHIGQFSILIGAAIQFL